MTSTGMISSIDNAKLRQNPQNNRLNSQNMRHHSNLKMNRNDDSNSMRSSNLVTGQDSQPSSAVPLLMQSHETLILQAALNSGYRIPVTDSIPEDEPAQVEEVKHIEANAQLASNTVQQTSTVTIENPISTQPSINNATPKVIRELSQEESAQELGQ